MDNNDNDKMDRDAMIAAGCLEEYVDGAVEFYHYCKKEGMNHDTIMIQLREGADHQHCFNYMAALDKAAKNNDMKKFKEIKAKMQR